MGRLDGKVALVSGGARGMGASHVKAMVAEGAKVVFGDVLHDEGRAVAAETGDACHYLPLDVRDEDAWSAAVAEAEGRYGKLNVLVNNAGVLAFGTATADTALADYMRVIEINQVGVFLGMKAAIPAITRARGGSIVNISSTNGLSGYGGTIAYTASKFAVRGMTKNAALELGKLNIRVNSVHPGGIATAMTDPETLGTDQLTADQQQAMFDSFPLGRVGEPAEVSRLIVFLASDDSSYSTGAEFVIDGGQTIGIVNPMVQPRYDD